MKYILEYLEDISRRYPDKIAFADTQKAVSFQEFTNTAQAVGSGINQALSQSGKPIAIFIDRSVSCLAAMMGTLYSGNFYAVLDVKSPLDRLQKILDTLAPAAIITDKSGLANGKALT
ncbi:MAG: AMP-binding protein, partial [Oscillospiraceae bacterium]|nr:AMP-binding protein [Oscillospiraceae bacterium]